jgi:hypothetical protein
VPLEDFSSLGDFGLAGEWFLRTSFEVRFFFEAGGGGEGDEEETGGGETDFEAVGMTWLAFWTKSGFFTACVVMGIDCGTFWGLGSAVGKSAEAVGARGAGEIFCSLTIILGDSFLSLFLVAAMPFFILENWENVTEGDRFLGFGGGDFPWIGVGDFERSDSGAVTGAKVAICPWSFCFDFDSGNPFASDWWLGPR